MLGRSHSKARSFTINLSSFFFHFIHIPCKRLNEIILHPVDWIFLLEERIDIIFLRLCRCIFLYIDWILQHFGIVHRTPTDKTPMVGEGGELILFDVAMNSLLYIEVLAHAILYNL